MNYVLMGDIHSVSSKFHSALKFIERRISDYHLIILGDVFDSRCGESDSVSVYKTIRELQRQGKVTVLHSNHQWKMQRYFEDNSVIIGDCLRNTLDEFKNSDISDDELYQWVTALPYAVAFKVDGIEYRCAHAYHSSKLYIPSDYEGIYRTHLVSGKMRSKLLYGITDTNHERIQWWKTPSNYPWIRCAGHYHNVSISYEDGSIVLDSNCGDENGLLSIFNVNNRSLYQF
jgi:UDP-2,3-diacylglucosamine pyrophosphatase LpxH